MKLHPDGEFVLFQPAFCGLPIRIEASDEFPKFGRMVEMADMGQLVNDDVINDLERSCEQFPIQKSSFTP